MIYLDNGATTLHKPQAVRAAVNRALLRCANPGRGGYPAAMEAAEAVFRCRSLAGEMFDCEPERVVFTMNCTHGLNMAIRTLVHPGDRVVISGFEHNAVTRPLHAIGARVTVAGRKLFSWEDTLADFDRALSEKPVAAILPMFPMSLVMCCRWSSWQSCAVSMGSRSWWMRPNLPGADRFP